MKIVHFIFGCVILGGVAYIEAVFISTVVPDFGFVSYHIGFVIGIISGLVLAQWHMGRIKRKSYEASIRDTYYR